MLSVFRVKQLINQYRAGKEWYLHYIKSSDPLDKELTENNKKWMESNQKELEILIGDLDKSELNSTQKIPVDEWLILEAENITKCIGNYHIKAQLIERYKSAVKAFNLGIRSEISNVQLHEKNLRAWVSTNKVINA